jgi:archaellum component FlaC
MGLLGRRSQDDEMIEGEPSTLGRVRGAENGHETEASGDTVGERTDQHEGDAMPDAPTDVSDRAPEGVREQLERLAGQIHGLQEQVEEFVARRSDAIADQASQRVAAIVQAAEESAREIAAEAHREGAELRERLRSEAQADADRIRVEAQADASKIRTEAHAAAAALREQTLAEVRSEVERITEQLAEQLRSSARAAIDEIAGGPAPPAPPAEAMSESEPPAEEHFEPAEVDVEEAVDELQSAAAVLEQSLRHLQEIGQGLPEAD